LKSKSRAQPDSLQPNRWNARSANRLSLIPSVRITIRDARIGITTGELDQKNRDWEGRTREFEEERRRFSVFVHSKVVLSLFLRLPISSRRARTQLTHATHAQLLHGLRPNQIHERASWAGGLWFLGAAQKLHQQTCCRQQQMC
jgi:hypothetical protein